MSWIAHLGVCGPCSEQTHGDMVYRDVPHHSLMRKKSLQPLLSSRSGWHTENYGAHSLAARKLVLLGAQGLIYGAPESGFLIVIGTGSWDGLGVGNSAQGPEAQENGHPALGCADNPRASPLSSRSSCTGQRESTVGSADTLGMKGTRKDKDNKIELMCLKFWCIKVILHSATEAMGQ